MHYNISAIFSLGTVQTSLITAVLYILPLNKRKNWKSRLILGVLACLLLSPALEFFRRGASVGTAMLETDFSAGCAYLGLCSAGNLCSIILMISALIFCCCIVQRTEALCAGICAYITQDFAYTLYVALSPISANRGTGSIVIHTLWLELVIMAVIYVLFYFIFARHLPQHGNYRFSYGRVLPVMLTAMCASVVMGSITKAQYDLNQTVLFRIVLIYDLLLEASMLSMLLMYKKGAQLKTEAEEERHLRSLQKQQYEQIQGIIETINHKCHDLRHQISALRRESSTDARERLLQDLERDVMIYESHMHTGNDVLDQLLTEKFLRCEQLGVQWTCMADGLAVAFLAPVDLYTLLGNALENAIESASEMQVPGKRILSVNIVQKGSMAFICIENYFQHQITFCNGLPSTTKADKASHGYGMRSIQHIVAQYSGDLGIRAAGDKFKLSILIPIP